MELENRPLSFPRGGVETNPRRLIKERRRVPGDMSSVSTSPTNCQLKRRSHSSIAADTTQNKRRRHSEDEGTIAVHNLHPGVRIPDFVAHIKRRISEMKDVEVEVIKCNGALPLMTR